MTDFQRIPIWAIFRYASLYFCCAIEQTDNELICLEVIHRYVELLDKYFGSVRYFLIYDAKTRYYWDIGLIIRFQVCELDIIFNFEKVYFILDEFLLAGEIQETSKKQVLKAIAAQDLIQEVALIQKQLAVNRMAIMLSG